ncbi:MAG: hypothetical protein KAV87_02440 [Desulfobacteraceae bacterium]|nr:hypothetical protein [Desulfobacteraceae bacterium]
MDGDRVNFEEGFVRLRKTAARQSEIFYPHIYTVIVKRAFLWFNAEKILYKIFTEADG